MVQLGPDRVEQRFIKVTAYLIDGMNILRIRSCDSTYLSFCRKFIRQFRHPQKRLFIRRRLSFSSLPTGCIHYKDIHKHTYIYVYMNQA